MTVSPDRRAVCDRVLTYALLVDAACAPRGLDRWLVLAICAQESGGCCVAWRPEPEFLSRYGAGIAQSVMQSGVTAYQRWWVRDPLVLATSFGLMQTLVVTAIERGMALEYPTSLCQPEVSLEAGCRQLAFLFGHLTGDVREPIRTTLLRWNGGGDPAYPDKVLAWRDDLMAMARG